MQTQTLKSPFSCNKSCHSCPFFSENGTIFCSSHLHNPAKTSKTVRFNFSPVYPPFSSNQARNAASLVKNCKGVATTFVGKNHTNSHKLGRVYEIEGEGTIVKNSDVATLGNLCVDIVLNVPSLPPASLEEKRAYMERLSASRPDKKFWEAGGNCNLAIAAARLGLDCVTLGHVGDEIYGQFLLDVLREEDIGMVTMNEDTEAPSSNSVAYETLLCWVLVDPSQRHGFCSRSDFSKEPAFSWMTKLSKQVQMAIKRSKILFCNGYVFDELSPGLITSALECAKDAGTAVFFDPGPRGRTLSCGTPDEQRALNLFLRMSDVVLLTADEAESLTGKENPILAGQALIKKGVHTKWVIIKMGARGSILVTMSSICCAPSFKVNVVDTVGCGDSFSAAVAFGFLHSFPAANTLTLANAVGAATAMGCGAGRNVANLDKVLELLRISDLNEDNQSWNGLIDGNLDIPEVILLSRTGINGSSDRVRHVAVKAVVSELLPKLEWMHERAIAPS